MAIAVSPMLLANSSGIIGQADSSDWHLTDNRGIAAFCPLLEQQRTTVGIRVDWIGRA
jgi:hypothetical protein